MGSFAGKAIDQISGEDVHRRRDQVKPTWGGPEQMKDRGKQQHYKWSIKVNFSGNLQKSPKRVGEDCWNALPRSHPGIDEDQAAVVVDVIEEDGAQVNEKTKVKHHTNQDRWPNEPPAKVLDRHTKTGNGAFGLRDGRYAQGEFTVVGWML